MGVKQRIWAAAARQRLIGRLGFKCVACGTTENLEIDCITPQGDEHHRRNNDGRMSFYHKQEKQMNVQLLCRRDHSIKTMLDESELCSCVECITARRNRRPLPKHNPAHSLMNDLNRTLANSQTREPNHPF